MLTLRSYQRANLDAQDLELNALPKTGAAASAAGSPYYFTGRPCRHGHIAFRYTIGGSCSACTRIRNAIINNRPRADGVKAVARRVRADAIGSDRRTYVPAKPCKHGHMLRFAGSGNCVDCHNASRAKRREADKLGRIRKQYGLGPEQHERLFQSQNRACAICEISFEHRSKMHVDHCHASGKVRALLCSKCNQAIGLFCDNPALMMKAAEYVNAHSA